MERAKLSVVTITLNEAQCLEDCYRSIEWADEWVVVDSGSEDGTLDLARRFADKVYRRRFDNFSNQWNHAIDQAGSDWVLVLAADETVAAGLRGEIEAVLYRSEGPSCYAMPRRNILFGKWLRYGGQYPDWSLRLFRRGAACWVGDIHERLDHAGELGRLHHPIIHRSFLTLSEWVEKMDRCTTQEARFAAQRGERASWLDVSARPLFWFLRMYVAQRGFLDGWPGLVHSICTFVHIFFRHAKLREGTTGHGAA